MMSLGGTDGEIVAAAWTYRQFDGKAGVKDCSALVLESHTGKAVVADSEEKREPRERHQHRSGGNSVRRLLDPQWAD